MFSVTSFRRRRSLVVIVLQLSSRNKSRAPRSSNRYQIGVRCTYENQYMLRDDVVTPLWRKPYSIQLMEKQFFANIALKKCYQKLKREVLKVQDDDNPALQICDQSERRLCPLEPIRSTDTHFNYRNKDEFTAHKGLNGKPILGFQIGKADSAVGISPDLCLITKKLHLEIVKVFQEFTEKSKYSFLDPPLPKGTNWHALLVRSTSLGEVMICPSFSGYHEEKRDHVQAAGEELKTFFETGPGKMFDVTSLYMVNRSARFYNTNTVEYIHLLGKEYITEKVLDCSFRISPAAFFQTYTKGAELLYSTVREVANITHNTTVLDVCCGTGTIGIMLSRGAKRVIGVEISQAAIEDSIVNAKLNGVDNIEFVCNKAHRLVRDLTSYTQGDDGDIVAVLNPGRPGVNSKVIQALRHNKAIRRIVYVSCKPYGNAAVNFIRLVQPECEKVWGEPFLPVKAIPIDMFPQTNHFELIIVFER